MFPVAMCSSEAEAKRVESYMIRKAFKPTINEGDKPLYMLRSTYRTVERLPRKRGESKRAPWRNVKRKAVSANADYRIFTLYEQHEAVSYNFFDMLETAHTTDETLSIRIHPGRKDLTRDFSEMFLNFWNGTVH